MTDGVTVHNGIAYANHDGVELLGDFYLPKDAKAAPALVAVHGGGWVAGRGTGGVERQEISRRLSA
jgi:acetyl esterase/lipase